MSQQMSYPLDKTQYNANAPQLLLSTRTRGIYSSEEDLICTAADGMRLQVSPGMAWMKLSRFAGVAYGNLSNWMTDLAYADGVLDRIDRVVVRWSATQNTVELFVKQGAFSSNPVAPAIEEYSSTNIIPDLVEIAICDVFVPHGAVEITSANITDQRLNDVLCGVMRDGVSGIPTQGLYNQFQEFMQNLETNLEENVASNLLLKIQRSNTAISNEITLTAAGWVQVDVASFPKYANWAAQQIWPPLSEPVDSRLWMGQSSTTIVDPRDTSVASGAASINQVVLDGRIVFFANRKPTQDIRVMTLQLLNIEKGGLA